MIPKIRVFAKAGVEAVYGGGYDRDQMFYEIRDIDFYDKEVTVWGCHNKDCGMCDDTYKFEDVEILMSTGLKDKNGVEIFEGDVLTLKYPRDRRYTVTAKVIRGTQISAMVLKFEDEFTTEEIPLYKISAEHNLEVLGNIYENPELLEVTE